MEVWVAWGLWCCSQHLKWGANLWNWALNSGLCYSGYSVSEFNWIAGHPIGVRELDNWLVLEHRVCCWRKDTPYVYQSLRKSVKHELAITVDFTPIVIKMKNSVYGSLTPLLLRDRAHVPSLEYSRFVIALANKVWWKWRHLPPKLDHKRSCSFHLVLSWNSRSGDVPSWNLAATLWEAPATR